MKYNIHITSIVKLTRHENLNRVVVIPFICLFVFGSCTQNPPNKIVKIILPDTAVTHRAIDRNYIKIQSLRKYLNLKKLQNGVDSFELRFYESGMWTPSSLYIIKNEDSTWICSEYYIWENYPPSSIYEDFNERIKHVYVDSIEVRNINLGNDWNSFIDSLTYFDFPNMISQEEIPNFTDIVNDGEIYSFEVADKNQYRYFFYHAPRYYKDSSNEKATQLVNYLYRLFGRHRKY
jgi:hypothetical protein